MKLTRCFSNTLNDERACWFCKFEYTICENPCKFTFKRPITKFYKSDDVNIIAAELRLTKTRPTSLYKRHNLLQETIPTNVNNMWKK